MAEKEATRAAYGRKLAELGEKHDFYVLDADLSGSTQTAVFAKKYPERFFNCGIAEGNMISVAAGIAATGVPAFASSFAMFACGRAFEQIRNSVAYPHLPVKICASHAGITVGEDGATHQFCEDIAIMRALPNMTVVCPADSASTEALLEEVLNFDGPVYMRLGRYSVPQFYTKGEREFKLGKGIVLADGKDIAIVATGIMVAAAMEARAELQSIGIDAAVIDIHTIKPIDEALIKEYAAKTGAILTAEEHSVIGGLGDAVASVIAEDGNAKLAKLGINDVYGTSAPAGVLLEHYGLNAAGIVEKAKKLLNK
ncbi:MAG: transketolase family protein [Clostridia bacterium]|nr:transketolase family protein [Clostridia bacterium]MBQ9848776.1 transketolase family protein [Clostridia bacterium]